MKIGVCSDTHSLNLPSKLLDAFDGVDLIIHAGDICDESVLKELKTIAPVKAVQGNMDDSSLKKKLPLREIIDVDGVRIGICHGHVGGGKAFENAQIQFERDNVQVVVFGHSHHALNEHINNILYFNPGSPNDVVKAKFFSFGILTIKDQSVKGEIIKI